MHWWDRKWAWQSKNFQACFAHQCWTPLSKFLNPPLPPTSTCPTIFVSTEPKLMAQLTTCRQSSTTNFWVISHWNKFRAYFNWYHTAWMNLLDTRASSKLLSKVADAICPTAVVPCCRVRLYRMKQYGVQWQQLVETMTNMLLSLNDSYLTYFIFFFFLH